VRQLEGGQPGHLRDTVQTASRISVASWTGSSATRAGGRVAGLQQATGSRRVRRQAEAR
jgi:hypothetical protein